MIVLDASVVVELLTNGAFGRFPAARPGRTRRVVPCSHLLDIEVVSAIRRLVAGRRIDPHRSEQVLTGLAALPTERYAHTPLLSRVWELRHNFTAYDATYVALAEATDSVLYTCDENLRGGHRAPVALFTR